MFDHPRADQYEGGLYWSRRWEYPWAIESAELVEPDGYAIDNIKKVKVLDVGCGSAPFLVYLGMMGCQAYGSDPGGKAGMEDTIDGFWFVFDKDFGKPYIKELRQEGMEDLSWPDNHFDRVFCLSVIEHLPTWAVKKGVNEMRRVLKPGGLLVISVDNGMQKDLIIENSGMPFHAHRADWAKPKGSRYIYLILGMVFRKE
jgi:SAM-dependent methyltransferase